MHRIALTAAALGLTACGTTTPYGGTISSQNVNCGAGVVGGAVLGGLAGSQIGDGQGQDLATAAGATVGGLIGATRPECQPRAYRQPAAPGGYGQPVLVGYDRYGRPVYR